MTKRKKIWDSDNLNKYHLNSDDITFLTSVGLDIGDFGFIIITPKFETYDEKIVLGYDCDVPIVCSENGVFLIEDTLRRFVNTSVKSFCLTLQLYRDYCQTVIEVKDDEEGSKIAHDTISQMQLVDKVAWTSSHNYWAIIGEQMIEGQL